MGRIQSSIGLVSGIPITDTVDQLIALAAKPRDLLQARTADLKNQQVAIGELTALTIAIQMSVKSLAESSVFQQRSVTSSNDSLIAASVTGAPIPGTYHFTPVRVAQNHQMISQGVSSLDKPLGGGAIDLRFGGFLDKSMDLSLLNGGLGVQRGKIRITDRSGASEVIDLRYAATVDDVTQAINNSEKINVWAEADGDAIRLTDRTNQSSANLRVQEIGFGTTAADLGLANINVAAAQATGRDLVQLFPELRVEHLNDGNGLSIRDELPDLAFTFQDGSAELQVDFTRSNIVTMGDLLAAINAADPTRLQAGLSSNGDQIVLTDLTSNAGGTFSVSSPLGGTLAEDLRLTDAAAGNTITSHRLLSGLEGVLLASLSGGDGLGPLGQISLTDRSGTFQAVDLSTAETLNDIIDVINGAATAITAQINTARNGIELIDTSGGSTSNFVVANADATNSADQLGITTDSTGTRINSGSLDLQVVHENMQLAKLNQGKGVSLGSILVTDSAGQTSGINLATLQAETVGDVLQAINGLGIGVEAKINSTGDGIMLVDTAGGVGTLTVAESGTGTTAADLGILGEATVQDIGGTPTQVIDGATTVTLQLGANDSLQNLVDKINELDIGIRASIFDSGAEVAPYRLSLVSERSGTEGEMLIDTTSLGMSFQQIVTAQDAVILVGSADLPGAGVLATSSTNQFETVIDGVQLTVSDVSDAPVTIDVETTDRDLSSGIQLFVSQYNKLRDKLNDLTVFNELDNSTGILFGSNETLRIETTLSNLVTGRMFGVGSIQSLEQIGVSMGDDGQLAFDQTKMQKQFEDDPAAFETFFTDTKLGFAAKFDAALETLAGENNSLLINRNESLQRLIDESNAKIEFWNDRLDRQEEQLLKQFYAMELAIAKIQANMSAIQSLANLAASTTSSN